MKKCVWNTSRVCVLAQCTCEVRWLDRIGSHLGCLSWHCQNALLVILTKIFKAGCLKIGILIEVAWFFFFKGTVHLTLSSLKNPTMLMADAQSFERNHALLLRSLNIDLGAELQTHSLQIWGIPLFYHLISSWNVLYPRCANHLTVFTPSLRSTFAFFAHNAFSAGTWPTKGIYGFARESFKNHL